MVDHITDTQVITIQVIHFGKLDITNVVAPTTILEGDGTKTVSYDVTNIGSEGLVYGRAFYTTTQQELPNSRWEATMVHNATATKTFSIPAPAESDITVDITIVAGYVL